jgi:hypothetical protein
MSQFVFAPLQLSSQKITIFRYKNITGCDILSHMTLKSSETDKAF